MLDAVNQGTTLFAMDPRGASASPRIWPRSSSWSLDASSHPVQRVQNRGLGCACCGGARDQSFRTNYGPVRRMTAGERPRDLQEVALLLVDGTLIRGVLHRAQARVRSTT